MTNFVIPNIFWTTVFGVTIVSFIVTFLGRAWCRLLPYSLRGAASYFLSPALGLATLVIMASFIGRFLPLGDSIFVPIATTSLLVLSIFLGHGALKKALQQGAWLSIFSIVCGVSMLVPLFVYGSFNSHNDTFTYLAHSNWLQLNSFDSLIPKERLTPLTTQVSLYQDAGLRMGASFFLALLQSIFNLQWSFEAYPSALICAISAACMALGFPLWLYTRLSNRLTLLALISMPSFMLGGLVFGANYGFLPQTVGLSMGVALILLLGPFLNWISVRDLAAKEIIKSTFPSVILLVGIIFSYSEITPFILAPIFGSCIIFALRYGSWGRYLIYASSLLGFSAAILNAEIIRAYAALRTQSGAVVGSPVDWSFIGYIAHALGSQGGAWDIYQWSLPNANFYDKVFGLIITFALLLVAFFRGKIIAKSIYRGYLLPCALTVFGFFLGFLYFRYVVTSPFPEGIGQSWSAFKLSEWAHPFLIIFVILAATNFRVILGQHFNKIIWLVFFVGLLGACSLSLKRATPIVQYYGGTRDLNHFYQEFRQTVINHCLPNSSIFLALNGQDHKFRQMVSYYLFDRNLSSDWMDDGYIYPRLLPQARIQILKAGDCLVERRNANEFLSTGISIGPFRISNFDGSGDVRISSINGSYALERDNINWWVWVENKAVFRLEPYSIPKDLNKTLLSFELGSRADQNITVLVYGKNGFKQIFVLHSKQGESLKFEKTITISADELTEVNIESDGIATQLSDKDVRKTSFIVKNLFLRPLKK